eukprot:TRINITY_DN33675_c0_g1_i1.p1 TRINITY_DN33675_c0_g1~~TRINITY_DN33675_c0_g1_i1.p1  ORF type:complete len:148 (+),score=18.26 TRINITY_DN33675_c0_g1_i1:1-444(+)
MQGTGKHTVHQAEDASFCYTTTSVNSGINSLFWRWCQPNYLSDSGGFTSLHAQAVLKLLLSSSTSLSSARLCLVLDGNLTSPGWPRCDVDIAVPTHKIPDQCSFGAMGLSYSFKNDNLTKAISAPCRSCDFGTCRGDPPLLERLKHY